MARYPPSEQPPQDPGRGPGGSDDYVSGGGGRGGNRAITGRVIGKIFGIKRGVPNAKITIPASKLFNGTVTTSESDGSFIQYVPEDYSGEIIIEAEGYRREAKKVSPGNYDLGEIKLSAVTQMTGRYVKGKIFQFSILNYKNLIFAVAVTILGFIFVSPKMPGILSLVAPLGAGILVFLSSRGKGVLPTIGYTVLFGGAWFLLLWIITAAGAGTLTNIETWLRPIDWLHWVGVPQGYLDAFKQGIRNVFGSIIPSPPEKPQAEKIGGYQALEVKFGSKYANYVPPVLYANGEEYSLPLTVINSNPSDSGLIIGNFYISSLDKEKDADMDNKTGFKLMCGDADVCNSAGKCMINPMEEKQITVSFTDKADCKSLRPLSFVDDSIINENSCNSKTGCRWSRNDECICPQTREKNNFTELCDVNFFGNNVKIEFQTVFDFSVSGNSEFGVVQKESDVKILPKPKITTSTGPLSVTVYFVPDYLVLDKQKRDVIMFTSISNKGGGSAGIKDVKVESLSSQIAFTDIKSCENEIEKIKIVNDGEERDMPCKLLLSTQTIPGAYATIPVSIQISYTYTKIESKSLSIYRTEYGPSDKNIYAGLPGYCPQS